MNKAREQEKANLELIADLKYKVKELEHEVSTLRSRLDDLRKAKNTTVTKREREVVEVGFKRDPKYEAQLQELEKKLKDQTAAHRKEIEELKKQHADELEKALKLQKEFQKQIEDLRQKMDSEKKNAIEMLEKQKNDSQCNHEGLLQRLKMRVSELEGDNSALIVENTELGEKVNSLHLDLSVKEAKWCEKEEQYKLKLKQQWGEKYEEWMAETERKINELTEANQLLRTYLHRSGQRIPGDDGRM